MNHRLLPHTVVQLTPSDRDHLSHGNTIGKPVFATLNQMTFRFMHLVAKHKCKLLTRLKTWTGNTAPTERVFHLTMGGAQQSKSKGLRCQTVNAACGWPRMEANTNDSSCMEIIGESDPPDSGFGCKKLNILPKKPGFYQ